MGFFLGFFFGIGAGVAFSQCGLNYPFDYEARPDGFGKITINLESLNPVYNTLSQLKSYFQAAKNKVIPSRHSPESHAVAEIVAETLEDQTSSVV